MGTYGIGGEDFVAGTAEEYTGEWCEWIGCCKDGNYFCSEMANVEVFGYLSSGGKGLVAVGYGADLATAVYGRGR